jgi:hypothetical protein
MKKTKVAPKSSKTKAKSKRTSNTDHAHIVAVEHDFIIIAGGGLVVLLLTVFLFLFQ